MLFNLTLFFVFLWHYFPQSNPLTTMLFYSLLIVAVSFLIYTISNVKFQEREHIQRRHLSFFRSLAISGSILTLGLYYYLEDFTLPSHEAIIISFLFSTFFIFVPYVLYYILSGTYGFKIDIWRKLVFTLALVYVFQLLLHQQIFQIYDLVFVVAFIGGYYLFTAPASKQMTSF